MVRYFIVIAGRVQGVGFRFFAQRNAIKYSLTGWVRNMDNGMVELEIQGSEHNVTKFLSVIKKGNTFINIEDYSIKKVDLIEDESKFKVLY